MEPTGYSRLQILLHWLVALLILGQYLLAEGIEEAWEIVEDGGTAITDVTVWQHIAFGALVFLFALWRITLRLGRGAPPAAEGESGLRKIVAKLTHLGLYALMILLPVSGAAAWFGGIEEAGDLHKLGKTALLALMALHVLGAFYNQFGLRNGTIARMIRAGD